MIETLGIVTAIRSLTTLDSEVLVRSKSPQFMGAALRSIKDGKHPLPQNYKFQQRKVYLIDALTGGTETFYKIVRIV